MEFVLGLVTGVTATIWFWPLLTILMIGLWVSAETLNGIWSLVLTAGAVFLVGLKWPEVAEFVSSNILLTIGLYILAAIVWSFFKFRQLVQKYLVRFKNVRDDFLKSKMLPNDYFSPSKRAHADPAIEAEFFVQLEYQYGSHRNAKTIDDFVKIATPKADDNKKALFMWAVYWPFSFMSFFVKDMVVTIAEEIYARMGGLYQRVADGMFKTAL